MRYATEKPKRPQVKKAGKVVRTESRVHEWDRFDGIDTDESWPVFCAYRDSPPRDRNLAALASRFSVTERTIYYWASEYMWRERAAKFDRFVDRKLVRIQLSDRRKAAIRHAELARGLGELAAVECRKMLANAKELIRENKLTPRELKQIADAAIKLERLTLGQSTENVRETSDLDRLENLSEAELLQLKALQAKVREKPVDESEKGE